MVVHEDPGKSPSSAFKYFSSGKRIGLLGLPGHELAQEQNQESLLSQTVDIF
jgi:hypothetical protein